MDNINIDRLLNSQGRLMALPKKKEARACALQWLSRHFSHGRFYSEREVNELLSGCSVTGDYALLRRELYENGLLERSRNGARYWRCDFLRGTSFEGSVGLRDLSADDIPNLMAVHQSLGYHDEISGAPFTIDDARLIAEKRDLPPEGSSEFFTAKMIVDPAAPAGTAGYLACYAGYPEPDQLWLGSLFIKQSNQRKGFGSAALHLIEHQARASGFTRIGLGVFARNTPGLRFWIGQGYRNILKLKMTDDDRAILSLYKDLD